MMREEHLSFEEIIKYINTLEITKENKEEIYIMDLHLADCKECLDKVRTMRQMDFAVDNWTAELQGDIYREQLKQKDGNVQVVRGNEVKTWIEQLFGKLDAAVEIRVDDKEELLGEETYTTKIITGSMDKFLGSTHKYYFNSQLTAVTRGRKVSYVDYGTEAIDKESGSKIIVNTSEADNRVIKIDLMNINSNKLPTVILTDMAEEDAILYAKEPVQTGGRWLVEFEGVNPGRYLLFIESV